MRPFRHPLSNTPRWVWVWTALFMLAGALPYAVGWLAAPEGAVFTGVGINPLDTNTYLADMQVGYAGRWLFTLPYTATPSRPVPLFMFYILLGHFARLISLSLPLTFHLARLACGGLFAVTAYHFLARCFDRPGEQKLALGLLLFTGGTGWLIAFGPELSETVRVELTPDLWLSDAVSFLAMLSNGHFTLSMTLMMGMIVAGERLLAGHGKRWAALAIAAGLGIVLVHAHQIAVVGLILGGEALWRAWPQRRFPWAEACRLAVVFVPVGLAAGALTWLAHSDPSLERWLEQGNTQTPPVWGMLNLYGPVWFLALAGLWHAVQTDSTAWRGVALWFVIVLVLVYVPVNFQRRFMEGWHVPVTVLAAAGLSRVIAPSLRTRLTARSVALIGVTLLALVAASPARTAISLTMRFVQRPGDPFFYAHADERGAERWLRAHARLDDVALAYFYTGNWLPGRAGVRVLVGHYDQTANARDRLADVVRFFDAGTPDAERIALLAEFSVDFVYVGADERALGSFDPASAAYLALVYASPSVQLYRVVPVRPVMASVPSPPWLTPG